jgi:hypothetical protein
MLLKAKERTAPEKHVASDVVVFLALQIVYYFTRFWLASTPVLPLLFLLFFVTCRQSFQRKIFFDRGLLFFAPFFILTVPSAFVGLAEENVVACTYFIFLSFVLWVKETGRFWLDRKDHRTVRLFVWIYIGLVLPFLVFPQLQQFGTKPRALIDALALGYVTEDTHGLSAFYYHAGEFGVVTASLAAFLLTSFRVAAGKIRFFSVDFFLYLVLVTFVLISRSASGAILAVSALLLNLKGQRLVGVGIWTTMLLLCLSQFFFPTLMQAYTTGSFQWRYEMAQRVLVGSSLLHFSPTLINTLSNWTHSLLLDMRLCYGSLIGALFIVTILVLPFFKERRAFFGWHALFYCLTLVGPVGGGPAMLTLATVCAYAERKACSYRSAGEAALENEQKSLATTRS